MNIHGAYIFSMLIVLASFWLGVCARHFSTDNPECSDTEATFGVLSAILHIATGSTIIYHIILACTAP